jgi:antitoxin component YwqK of YwqJK toxin-antitoxin module
MAEWGAVKAADGRVLLEGAETFWYPNGKVMRTTVYHLGRKTGEESFFREDGTKEWVKRHADGGEWTWRRLDATGKQVAESKWNGKTMISTDVPDVPKERKPGDEKLPEPEGL